MEQYIELKNIKKEYNNKIVLNIKNLKFEQGKRYAIIGRNGTGKSTLFNILTKTLKQDTGTIIYSGIRDKEIGYMPQAPYAFDFSVLKNVEMACMGKNKTEKAINSLERVRLSKLIYKNANSISGGEQQKMFLARILAEFRKVIILDEPFSNMDISSINYIQNEINKYQKETNCILIYSTHTFYNLNKLSDEVLLIDNGIFSKINSDNYKEFINKYFK